MFLIFLVVVTLLYLPSILKGGWLFDDPALTDIEWKFKEGRYRLNYGPAVRNIPVTEYERLNGLWVRVHSRSVPYPAWLQFWNHPRALAMWTFQRTYDVFGFRCWAHRAVNLILHLAATGLVYLIASHRLPASASLLAAGIFALHPLQVSAVAYVSARPAILAACFAFAACYCLGNGFIWAAVLSQFLAQKSKEDSWIYLSVWPLCIGWFYGMPSIIAGLYLGLAAVLIRISLPFRKSFRGRPIVSSNTGVMGR